jgi:hypothetical protein
MTRRGETAQMLSRAALPLGWLRFHPFLMFAGYGLIGALPKIG